MSASPPTTAADRLVGLDTLRTIAIVHVVLAHGAMTFMPALPGVGGRVVWWLIAANFGVPLFFVLSGFLITRQLEDGMPTGTFYRHRLAKIYPTFALAVVVFYLRRGLAETESFKNAQASDAPKSSGFALFKHYPRQAFTAVVIFFF